MPPEDTEDRTTQFVVLVTLVTLLVAQGLIFRSYAAILVLFSYGRFSGNITFFLSIHAFQSSDLSPSALFALSVHAAGGAGRRQTACYTLISDTIRLLILASASPRGAGVSPLAPPAPPGCQSSGTASQADGAPAGLF